MRIGGRPPIPCVSRRVPASLVLCALISVPSMACGGRQASSSMSYGDNAQAAYEEALIELRANNCLEAEPAFRNVRRQFPYSRFAALAELRAADCLFNDGKFVEAIQAYRDFVRHRPSHSEVPYARFRVAESYVEQIPTDWLLAPPAYERDQSATHEALKQIRRFIADFPNESFVPRAQELAKRALRLLAEHELYVADFYADRDEDAAAASRLRTLLQSYPGSGLESKALLKLGQTYARMGSRNKAIQAFRELLERFPTASQADEARAELGRLGG